MGIDREKILSAAQKYVLKGQSEKAIKEYQKLVKASPKDIRSHLKLGDLYLKNGQNEKAITEYLKVAELYTEEDLSSRAISVYKRILSLDPKRIEALHRIARLYLKEGLKADAKNYYQSLLKLKPNDQDALEALKQFEDHDRKEGSRRAASEELVSSYRLSAEGQNREVMRPPSAASVASSEAPYDTATASVDKDAEMHYHLGIAYKEMELYDYAITEFEIASSNASIEFDCYIMLGDCFMEKGNHEKSIEYYRMASGVKGLSDEKLARLQFNLGVAYEASGMTSEALDAFHSVLKLDQTYSQAEEKIKKLQESREN